jgi:hypothetical protein
MIFFHSRPDSLRTMAKMGAKIRVVAIPRSGHYYKVMMSNRLPAFYPSLLNTGFDPEKTVRHTPVI